MIAFLRRVAVVALLGLLVLIGARRWGPDGARARYDRARAHVADECRAYRSQPGHEDADVCRYDEFGPHSPASLVLGEAKVNEARIAFVRGDGAAAVSALRVALGEAHAADRLGSLMAAFRSAHVVDGVVDVVRAFPSQVPPAVRRELLEGARLESARSPYERERVQRLWVLAHFDQLKFADVPSPGPGNLAREIATDDAAFLEMQRAALAGDVARCENAARTLGEHAFPDVYVRTCSRMTEVARVDRRVSGALAEID